MTFNSVPVTFNQSGALLKHLRASARWSGNTLPASSCLLLKPQLIMCHLDSNGVSSTFLSGVATGGPVQRETGRKCDKQAVETMRGPRLTVELGFVTTDRDGGRQIQSSQDPWLLSQTTNQSASASLGGFMSLCCKTVFF